jgi:4-amino-4-deoxy-L-arabinose transferase-like glycosyltransferase
MKGSAGRAGGASVPKPRSATRARTPHINWNPELAILAAIVLAALAIRVFRLGDLPDTVLADEADNVQTAARILHGRPPENGLFGLDWTQQPAFSAYKQAAFLALFGFNIVAMRLPSALISVLALVPFYIIARRQMSILAASLAAMLLATNVWYLNFSRSGWNCIDIGCYMLLAMLTLLLGLDSAALGRKGRRSAYIWFGASGFSCALGIYGYPAGRAIILAALAFLPVALLYYRRATRTILQGYTILLLTAAAAFAPQAAYALSNWQRFNQRTGVVFIMNSPQFKADPVGTMLRQLSNNVRGPWDGSVNNTPQYSPVGESQLDGLTGLLVLGGMVLTVSLGQVRRRAETWLWWLMLLTGWASTQLTTANTPNGARGIGYMPAFLYFAGMAIHYVAQVMIQRRGRRYRRIASLALVGGLVSAIVLFQAARNVAHYVEWQGNPRTRQARYIYLTAREFPAWADDIVARATEGSGVTNLTMWRAQFPIHDAAYPYGGTP